MGAPPPANARQGQWSRGSRRRPARADTAYCGYTALQKMKTLLLAPPRCSLRGGDFYTIISNCIQLYPAIYISRIYVRFHTFDVLCILFINIQLDKTPPSMYNPFI
jgi:hypothetical protein